MSSKDFYTPHKINRITRNKMKGDIYDQNKIMYLLMKGRKKSHDQHPFESKNHEQPFRGAAQQSLNCIKRTSVVKVILKLKDTFTKLIK